MHFRKRLNRELVGKINEQIVLKRRATEREAKTEKQKQQSMYDNRTCGQALCRRIDDRIVSLIQRQFDKQSL